MSASDGRDAAPLLPDQWRALEPLVDALLDAEPARRESLLVELSAGDLARQAVLRAMLDDCLRELPLLDAPAEERFDQLLLPEEEEVALPDVLGERYRIERELGRGGMARVYLAQDLKHDRSVAVKVIRPDVAASLGRERFLREIGIAARLRHPNIVPLFDSGDAQGVLYFVMPYESGESLRERLDRSKPLPASEYVSVLRDIARALAYAHGQGVVHRDVKPDNVMLSGGAAVVTDFGIAKAVSIAQGAPSTSITLTQPGGGVGTPTYMAPEQAIGDPAMDHRADLYAFGCVAYELISGAPPFHDVPFQQLVLAHVATQATPLQVVAPDVSHPIAQLVMRCLAKDPADRPQTAQELVDALQSPDTSVASGSSPAYEAAPIANRVPLIAALAALVIGGGGYAAWRARADTAAAPRVEATIAILPMESVGGDSLQGELADGLSDEVATALVHEAGMRVMSRKGVGNYRGRQDLDYARVGRELGARFLLTGQLRSLEGRATVGATLHDASDGSILWKESYVQDQSALDVLRDSISRGVAGVLRERLGLRELAAAKVVGPASTMNVEAYRLYILGQRALERRGQSLQSSVSNFERAVTIDSTYAAAYAGLSLARALLPYFGNAPSGTIGPLVRDAAAHALRLDSTQAAPHVALALMHQYAYQWDSAAVEFQIALRLRTPGDVEPLVQYGRHLMYRGRARDALQPLRLARQNEPASALVSSLLSNAFYLSGLEDSSLVEMERAYQSDSNNLTTLIRGSLIALFAGRREEARRLALRINPMNPMGFYVLAALGDDVSLPARLQRVSAMVPPHPQINILQAYIKLGAGDTTAALTFLERAVDHHELFALLEAANHPMFEPLWPSARYAALLQRVGLGNVPLRRPGQR